MMGLLARAMIMGPWNNKPIHLQDKITRQIPITCMSVKWAVQKHYLRHLIVMFYFIFLISFFCYIAKKITPTFSSYLFFASLEDSAPIFCYCPKKRTFKNTVHCIISKDNKVLGLLSKINEILLDTAIGISSEKLS